MDEMNDGQLVAKHLGGDEQSLDVLVARYVKPVYRLIYSYVRNEQEAEDITQEVFVRAWKNLYTFDPEQNFKTWIFTIAKRASIDALRKKKAVPFSAFENKNGDNILFETLADDGLLPDEISERNALGRMIAGAMTMLSPQFQTVLSMHYTDDLTFANISKQLDEPIDTVKSRHHRAIAALKRIIGKL